MADIKSPEERSRNMSKIRSRDTKPEEYIRKKLFSRGYRYRKNSSRIFGHPDAWLAKYNTAIFVNGCFWHRHSGCKYAYSPKSRIDFWTKKFNRNVERDREVISKLKEDGIRVLKIWECTVKRMMKSVEYENLIFMKVEQFICSEEGYLEV